MVYEGTAVAAATDVAVVVATGSATEAAARRQLDGERRPPSGVERG